MDSQTVIAFMEIAEVALMVICGSCVAFVMACVPVAAAR